MDKKPEIKTIKVGKDTWKKLAQMKLDCFYSSMDELLRDLLQDAGY